MMCFALFILISYLLLVLYLLTGWRRMKERRVPEDAESDLPLTVIVCAHNEEKSLPSLIDALKRQSYPHFKVMLVNDHSTDATELIIQQAAETDMRFRAYSSRGNGKKHALREAIALCDGEWIVQTDADCLPSPDWLCGVAEAWRQEPCDMGIMAVRLTGDTLFQRMQTLEFLSLSASGAGAAGMGNPLMCNAANLLFSKSLYEECQADLCDHYRSGDDMFLLLAAKRRGKRIRFLKNRTTIVSTPAAENLRAFVRQRSRWASKSGGYRDLFVIAVAIIVALTSLLLVALLLMAEWGLWALCFGLKFVVDALFLYDASDFYGLRKEMPLLPLVALVYPFYILVCGVGGLLFTKNSW